MLYDLDLEELHGDLGFFLDASRRQQVGVSLFVFAVAEIVGFHQTFFNQRLNAIVHPPEADAQIPGQFALADLRIGLQAFQDLSLYEGIIPALESAHALAHVTKIAPMMKSDQIILVNLSGRGDKDVASASRYVFGEELKF